MSIDISSLLMKIDTKQLKNATAELNSFTKAGQKAKDGISSLGEETASSGSLLAQSLLEEEEMLRQSYENRRDMILGFVSQTESERASLMAQANSALNETLSALDAQNMQGTLAKYEQTYDGIAGIVDGFGTQMGAVFGNMFGASKAFAIADGTIQMVSAIMKAANMPFPANLGAMATVAAATAGLLSQIKGTNFAGAFDGGGHIPFGKWGLVGEYGPEIVRGPANVTGRADTEEILSNAKDGSGGERTATFNLYDNGGNLTEQIRGKLRSREMDSVVDELAEAMRRRGLI